MEQVNKKPNQDCLSKGLKNLDELSLALNEDFFDKFHDKIMVEIEKVEMAPPPSNWKKFKLGPRDWRACLYSVGGVSAVIILSSLLQTQVAKINQTLLRVGLFSDGRERIVAEVVHAPSELAQTLISSENETDFFMDVARESFENLPESKIKNIVGKSEL